MPISVTYRAGPVVRLFDPEDITMYTKPSVSRFGTFRDLTQFGCSGTSDLTIPGIGASDGDIPEIAKGLDGIFTTKICFSFLSGM